MQQYDHNSVQWGTPQTEHTSNVLRKMEWTDVSNREKAKAKFSVIWKDTGQNSEPLFIGINKEIVWDHRNHEDNQVSMEDQIFSHLVDHTDFDAEQAELMTGTAWQHIANFVQPWYGE